MKTNRLRSPERIAGLFAGRVLDIGCGDDLVVPHAEPFDRAQGNAERILDHLPPGSFDCVHSSHCLEHMEDVRGALAQWWSLVRPGGYLVLVVPEEDLYEQGSWPSAFNREHKATFRLDRETSWSPVSFDLRPLLDALPGAEILEIEVQDQGYDHTLRRRVGWRGRHLHNLGNRRSAAMGRFLGTSKMVRALDSLLTRFEFLLGRPVDQTGGDALAQIQAVIRKTPAALSRPAEAGPDARGRTEGEP